MNIHNLRMVCKNISEKNPKPERKMGVARGDPFRVQSGSLFWTMRGVRMCNEFDIKIIGKLSVGPMHGSKPTAFSE